MPTTTPPTPPETPGDTCLNCGKPGALTFCPHCGQRHIPSDQLDLRHVWLEYVERGSVS